jgi:hypothetical protein
MRYVRSELHIDGRQLLAAFGVSLPVSHQLELAVELLPELALAVGLDGARAVEFGA